jgi:hypothetical protein
LLEALHIEPAGFFEKEAKRAQWIQIRSPRFRNNRYIQC